MATDIYGMLTGGYDPRAEQMKQQQAFQQQLSTTTDPRAFIAAVGSNMGRQIGQGVQGLFGNNPEQEKANLKKDALAEVQASGIDMTDQIAVLKAITIALQKRGLTAEAAQVGASIPQDKDNTTDLLKNFTVASVAKYKQSGNLSDLVRVVEDKGDGTQVVEADGRQVLINKATGVPIRDLGAARPVPAGTTVVNTQEKAESKAYGESLVKSYEAISNSAKIAANTKVAFESQLGTLNKGFDTGFGTEAKAAAANLLGALGVESAENFATNAQVFKAAASSAILTKQLEQKGPQTEADAKRIQDTSAQLGNTKAANTFLAKVGIALANRDIKQRDFYSKWRTKNKTFEGAEAAWLAGEGGESLFDSPELKQYKRTDPTEGIPGQGGQQTAPIYATNPQTGQRIMSTDGGKTWQETRN